ncbi:filamentous muscle protein titin-animal, related protein, putative [Rhizoctonia solani AG-3 Rhs1AP]|uniref:Filamentous muscle protein titin-animal, related protein, putative n=1 Tax=Rhizoctonia solani AG-3 Rhs1AP TaxID=1086054 RepID=X8JIR7_9AGAM|nr:filamentous muscle protein titin-animal, related protein, putative [Rhizoctonia solani AG-3 Rhs1AP]
MADTLLPRGGRKTDNQHEPEATNSGYHKPLPDPFGFNGGRGKFEGGLPAKPLVELEMTRLSAEIRRKYSWWTKYRDESILIKWREEALAQASLMDESHIDYVLKELDGYANLRDEASGAEVSCYDKIWQSDTLIRASLKEQLVAGVAKLENVPESEKDWHPRSNGQVLDLVHPSLYPIVYGHTLSYPEDSNDRDSTAFQARLRPPVPKKRSRSFFHSGDVYYISERFQWLPTDFEVSEDGLSVKRMSYINNLHPLKHEGLYNAIEALIAAYVPLFERVLTDSIPDNGAIPERTFNGYSYNHEAYERSPDIRNYHESDYDQLDRDHEEWAEGRPIILPHIQDGGYKAGSLEKRDIKYTLRGRTIQVIVKLANIHLTPEEPTYSGGSWHVEGMENEAIAASGIYYYDEENITESRLAFRTAVAVPIGYEQDDQRGCMLTWGMGRDDPCVNELGSVVTCQDRCIAFPNTYQHRVSPFQLTDRSKPGHRKIVALFLVDPAIRRPSTTTVPPQQAKWRASGIGANPVLKRGFDKLAPEIIDHIDSMVEGSMTRKEAEAYRLELMDERTAFVVKNDEEFFVAPFALCEH